MLTHGSMFTGIGLLDYGLCLAGLGEPVWVAEKDEWRRSILARRFPGAVRYDDVRAVGAACERVELVAGGFPCKGASTAGKRNGFDHAETVLWREMARAVGELRPRYVLVENVANILGLHDGAVWAEVLGDLAALGYRVVWDCLPAAAVGAPHLRDRVFAIASQPASERRPAPEPAIQQRRMAAVPRARANGHGVASNAAGESERAAHHEAHAEPGGRLARQVPGRGDSGYAALTDADAGGQRQSEQDLRSRRGEPDAARGVRVAWGEYAPAIARWEAIHGSAPEPLVRRMDDRSAARVERSRLSALGDGVQVQVGAIAGAYILSLEQERLAA